MRTATKKKSEPLFAKGDVVSVSTACCYPEHYGKTGKVTRRFFAEPAGGQPASWVYELDIPHGTGVNVTLFERFMSAAK